MQSDRDTPPNSHTAGPMEISGRGGRRGVQRTSGGGKWLSVCMCGNEREDEGRGGHGIACGSTGNLRQPSGVKVFCRHHHE
jgi:hypothetical protein